MRSINTLHSCSCKNVKDNFMRLIFIVSISDIGNLPWIEDVYLGIYLMAMSTTLVNPMVYYFINTKFRHYFQNIFICEFYKTHSILQFSQKSCIVSIIIKFLIRNKCLWKKLFYISLEEIFLSQSFSPCFSFCLSITFWGFLP